MKPGNPIHGRLFGGLAAGAVVLIGCGNVSFFNPAFLNTVGAGNFPIAPGPGASFVLVRVVNELTSPADFIVTIERVVFDLDENGNVKVDETGAAQTKAQRETVRLRTFPFSLSNEIGVLFPCSDSPITRLGLGQNLLPGDPAVFVFEDFNPDENILGAGFGVPAAGLNILEATASPPNFQCGDTVIFRAIVSQGTGTAGNARLQAFLIPGFEQPSIFAGPNTFVNYEVFLESQVTDEP